MFPITLLTLKLTRCLVRSITAGGQHLATEEFKSTEWNISKSKLSHVQTLKIYPEFKRRYLKNFTQLCCELSGARGMNAISKMAQPNAPFIRQAYVKKRQRRKFYFLMRL